MGRIVAAFFLVLLASSMVLATWVNDFQTDYLGKGIDIAVENAVESGGTPYDIIDKGLGFEDLAKPDLIRALYCAGVEGKEIWDSAAKHKISRKDVVAGYKQSVEECADKMADSHTSPAASGFNMGGNSSVSPSQMGNLNMSNN